jgi:branched-chain amino acid transport system ATP-binding protein
MTTPALELDGLSVHYGPVAAVREVSLQVNRGEIVGLIGPNGAGKSSTLHAIMGLVPQTQGDVRMDAASLIGRRPEDIARSGVALVPEGRRIFPELTVDENLRLGAAAQRGGRRAYEEGIGRIYELFPAVADSRRRQAGALSGGQQQQLAIARALLAQPDVLLLDEPSLGLAPQVVDAVFETLSTIRDQGLAILLVEQRAQRTVALADRSHVMSNGRVRLTLGPGDAADTQTMVAAYLA